MGRHGLARVRRSNYYFHSAIYTGAGSEMLRGIIERLWPRFATDLLSIIPGRAEQSIEQHQAILDALRERNEELTVERMSEHIMTAGDKIVEFRSARALVPSRLMPPVLDRQW